MVARYGYNYGNAEWELANAVLARWYVNLPKELVYYDDSDEEDYSGGGYIFDLDGIIKWAIKTHNTWFVVERTKLRLMGKI